MNLELDIVKRLPGFSLDMRWNMGCELMVLFGPSGSGKSVTLRLISGVMSPDAGLISCGGRVFYDSRTGACLPPQKRGIGYMFQNAALFPNMTVRRNIAYGLKGLPRKTANERVDEMAVAFGLASMLDKRPSHLSGGQRQRVALARAIAPKPGLLLLDEPFSALDRPVREKLGGLLLEIRRNYRVPMVLVTHDILEAARLGDRMIVCNRGRVEQSGTPLDIISRPATPVVRRLVDVSEMAETIRAIHPERLAGRKGETLVHV